MSDRPKLNIVRRAVAIYEVGRCESWRIEGLNGYRLDETTPTAAEALQLVQARDAASSESVDGMIVTTISWYYYTGIGRIVTRAVTGQK
jgi:hypothetical protein